MRARALHLRHPFRRAEPSAGANPLRWNIGRIYRLGTGKGVGPRPGGPRSWDATPWFGDGARRKVEARRRRACVECGGSLSSPRAVYCTRRCQQKFHGRYFWDAARHYVLRRDRYTCQVCRVRFRACELDVDHIHEIADGGAWLDYTNLQAICRPCHRAKTQQYLRARRRLGPPPPTGSPTEPPTTYWLEWFPS